MRGVAQQPPALAQGLEHQRDVPPLEIADAAVDQLGAAAGGPLGEVVPLDQRRPVPPRRRLDRGAEAGGAAPHDEDVPGLLAGIEEPGEHVGAVHPSSHPFARSTARFQRARWAAAWSRSRAGSKRLSTCQRSAMSPVSFQTPVARPAR